ncbi:MAG: non-ribosomal peptide synthetase, partial [bacterium]|nr:non-ribosomal peptide synthetase [bacterium]
GYLNKPELTGERFIRIGRSREVVGGRQKENEPEKGQQSKLPRTALQIEVFGSPEPFLQKGFWPPEARFYRTGDLARWLPDGKIEFLGRIDHQVKIRGHRVELGEIENRLVTHTGIKEAVVLVRKSKNRDNILCAYYVTENTPHPETSIRQPPVSLPTTYRLPPTASIIRPYLSQYLPDYMIPSFFINLEKIPLTPNGKIDRKTLSRMQLPNVRTQTTIAPQNHIQRKLAEIWEEILGLEKETISTNEDFFNIGGHSLRATVMATRIHKEFNVRLPLME